MSSQDVSFYLCGMCFVCLCLCMFHVIFAREINVVCASDIAVASSGSFILGTDGRNREKQVLGEVHLCCVVFILEFVLKAWLPLL